MQGARCILQPSRYGLINPLSGSSVDCTARNREFFIIPLNMICAINELCTTDSNIISVFFTMLQLKFYAIDISNLYGYFFLFLVQSQDRYLKPQKNVQAPVRVKPLCLQFHSLERQRIITHSSRVKRASVICAAALVTYLI